MSNQIVRSQRQALAQLQASRMPVRRVPRRIVRQVEEEAGQGLVAATRVQAAAYATHVAVQSVGMLSAEEARVVESCPASDPVQKAQVAQRVRLLVDNFTGVAASAIADLGQ